VYPSIALQAKVGGTVVLEATIGRTGVVTDVRVLRSVPLLDAAAVAAVQQWRYEPTRLNGEPVAVLLTVTVRFAP
jgi:protein TonB